jgi:lysophospholipase L1-like esterase
LGVAVEHDNPGVVYDVLGINGHRVTAFNLWNEQLLAAQLRHRPADLVILSYGGNEALARPHKLPLPQYQRELDQALEVVERLTPNASHLLVGPSSLCPPRPRLDRVAEIMGRAAQAKGYAFWDLRQVTGGPGSLCSWRRAHPGWVAPDGIHFRLNGYQEIGRLFLEALLADY